jgi:hypothetical protein
MGTSSGGARPRSRSGSAWPRVPASRQPRGDGSVAWCCPSNRPPNPWNNWNKPRSVLVPPNQQIYALILSGGVICVCRNSQRHEICPVLVYAPVNLAEPCAGVQLPRASPVPISRRCASPTLPTRHRACRCSCHWLLDWDGFEGK